MSRQAILVDEKADALQGFVAQFNSGQPRFGLGTSVTEEAPYDRVGKIGFILE